MSDFRVYHTQNESLEFMASMQKLLLKIFIRSHSLEVHYGKSNSYTFLPISKNSWIKDEEFAKRGDCCFYLQILYLRNRFYLFIYMCHSFYFPYCTCEITGRCQKHSEGGGLKFAAVGPKSWRPLLKILKSIKLAATLTPSKIRQRLDQTQPLKIMI